MVPQLWLFFWGANVGFGRELSVVVGSCREVAVDVWGGSEGALARRLAPTFLKFNYKNL